MTFNRYGLWIVLFLFMMGQVGQKSLADPADWSQDLAIEHSPEFTPESTSDRTLTPSSSASGSKLFTQSWILFFAKLQYAKKIDWNLVWEGRTPYQISAEKFQAPASVLKLITSAAALKYLGRDFQFFNSFQGEADDINHILFNPEFVVSGDPTWGHEAYGETLRTRVDEVSKTLIQDGIKAVQGPIQISLINPELNDSSRPAGWKPGWSTQCFAAITTPVILAGNCAQLKVVANSSAVWTTEGVSVPLVMKLKQRTNTPQVIPVFDSRGLTIRYEITGSVNSGVYYFRLPVHQGEQWLKNLFVRSLARAGIKYTEVAEGSSASANKTWFTKPVNVDLSSKPLHELSIPFMQNSINVVADRLAVAVKKESLARAVIEITGQPELQNGLAFLDGSGLNLQNQINSKTVLEFLKAARHQSFFTDWVQSFAVAGESGTLKGRMLKTVAKGRVFGKTGTLDGVINLSGYYRKNNQDFEPFSVMTQSNLADATVRSETDQVVTQLVQDNLFR